jgi:O-antigen/teichoic acid export membrane protein
LTLAVGIVLIVSISTLLKYFVPQNYNQFEIAQSVIIGLSLTPIYILYLQNTHIIAMTKKFKTLAKITPIAALIQFVFTFVFVKFIGIKAPAIGLIVALVLQAILISLAVGKFNKLSKAPIISALALSAFSYSFLYLL